jgi:predicted Rossmann-fold nucleotide-binding protein
MHSEDGIITEVLNSAAKKIILKASFKLSGELIELYRRRPESFIFSERSRIARLGVQIKCEDIRLEHLDGENANLTLVAAPVIRGYPDSKELRIFFKPGFPVGRLVFCDPEALMTSDEVLNAVMRSELKLPASTTVSNDGSILIRPHNIVCSIKEPIDSEILGRILLQNDGREILNRYQHREEVSSIIVPPGEGVVTTCSMYLNQHYVVLQSGSELGKQLPATVLDPIKTRGVRIYLEIVNEGAHPIVNPLVYAKIYRATPAKAGKRDHKPHKIPVPFSYEALRAMERKLDRTRSLTCHFLNRPMAVVTSEMTGLADAAIVLNGPDQPCKMTKAQCATVKRYASPNSICPAVYGTSKLTGALIKKPVKLVMKYFPNLVEHRDLVNLICKGLIESIYFFEPSQKYGQFLSDRDHNQLEEYFDHGVNVYWVSGLTSCLMVSALRDRKGYFVMPGKLHNFHTSMLFAFYGSNKALSKKGLRRLTDLIDALIGFWGKNIGILTGGGSGVMQEANRLARERGILSGANFLDITDQAMTTDIDFCQVFQSTGRHSRQKWFEVTSFPIFNVGGLGSLEELGITLCNMKLSIIDHLPIVLFDTEGDGDYWRGMGNQIGEMIDHGKAPSWIRDYLVITNDPKVVIDAYLSRLQLFQSNEIPGARHRL